MPSANRHCHKRFIALMMLIVWIFTLGAGLANACSSDDARRGAPAFDSAAVAMAGVMPPSAMQADGHAKRATEHNGHHHAGFHQVHCQPMAPMARPQALGQPAKKSFALDVIVASLAYGSKPARLAERQTATRRRPDLTAAEIPLFIRFRRLLP